MSSSVNSSEKRPANTIRTAVVTGTGSYLPERVVTNVDIEEFVDTTDEWIRSRTGMKERRIARDDEATSDMGAQAALRAIEDAGLEPSDIDMILAPSITPDIPWPNTACLIQDKIGAKNAACLGLEAACSGFVYAMETGRTYIASGSMDTVLVVAAEKMSSILDWSDRSTCVLFGDGAGAAVLQPGKDGHGIFGSSLGADGSLSELLLVPAGGSRLPASEETVKQHLHYLKMNGRETFKNAVTNMANAGLAVLEKYGVAVEDVDWVIPHQANMRIIQAVGQRLGVAPEKVVVNIEKYANTSGATIGIALDEAVRDGRIKKGDLVLFVAFGGGFTWGAMLLEWTKQ